MPFPLITTTLSIGFVLIWAFIAAMILRDCHLAARRDREFDGDILPLRHLRRDAPHGPAPRKRAVRATARNRRQIVRAAS